MERYLAERFQSMVRSEARRLQQPFLPDSAVESAICAFEAKEAFRLNAEQRRAVHMAATHSLSVITGGAGVGKTTVLKVIHPAVEALGARVYQMALAGRAAQRMRETTEREAYTIIGFLNRLKAGTLEPEAGDLVVVDEASMLDLMLMYRLLRALPVGARLLLVGDPYQLPPIGPGLVFHVLADSAKIPITRLIQVHRQAESTGIPSIAHQIRNGVTPDLAEYQGLRSGVCFVECRPESVLHRLVDIINDLGGFHEAQILGVTKAGFAGVFAINRMFHQILTPTQPRLEEWDLAESDPILYTVNDYERELFNGSLGYIEKVFSPLERNRAETSVGWAIGNFDGRRLVLSDADIPNIELAYAITVHKAQGSQFPRVVIPVLKNRLMDRTLIYTALTRGVQQVVFLGDRQALQEAVIHPPSASLRKVGFSL